MIVQQQQHYFRTLTLRGMMELLNIMMRFMHRVIAIALSG